MAWLPLLLAGLPTCCRFWHLGQVQYVLPPASPAIMSPYGFEVCCFSLGKAITVELPFTGGLRLSKDSTRPWTMKAKTTMKGFLLLFSDNLTDGWDKEALARHPHGVVQHRYIRCLINKTLQGYLQLYYASYQTCGVRAHACLGRGQRSRLGEG